MTSPNAKKQSARGAIGPTACSTRTTIRILTGSASSQDRENASVATARTRKSSRLNPVIVQHQTAVMTTVLLKVLAMIVQMETVLKDQEKTTSFLQLTLTALKTLRAHLLTICALRVSIVSLKLPRFLPAMVMATTIAMKLPAVKKAVALRQ